LKDNCFKVDIHLMPDLPQPLKEGVDIKKKTFMPEDIDWSVNMLEEDRKMLRTVINNPNFQAD
jgi:histone acetyltransferase (RNA polymerase elongator complex component)